MAQTYLIAILIGVIPVLAWMWFWLRYDRNHPEPALLLVIAFLLGAGSVIAVLPLEKMVIAHGFSLDTTIVLNASIEEIMKLLFIALFAFPSRYLDEPIDYAMYLISGGLGFAALENVLFLMEPASTHNITLALATGNLRFMGATVLHGLTAAIIGITMAHAFYKPLLDKLVHLLLGLIGAIALHVIFNFFIIRSSEYSIAVILGVLWVIVMLLMHLFTRLRYLYQPSELYGKEFLTTTY